MSIGIRTPKFLGGLFLLAAIAAWAYPATGQTQTEDAPKPPAAGPQTAGPTAVIKTESRIVLVDAVVRDKKGNYIPDLAQQDFKVLEDNKEQAITSFSF